MNSDSCVNGALCPLNRIKAGTVARIRQLTASVEVSTRLREIGFCEDQVIRLIVSSNCLICQVCNSRLALNPQLAEGILVEPLFQKAA